jgi:WD40 repeat protein
MTNLPGDPPGGSRYSEAAAADASAERSLDLVAKIPSSGPACQLLYAQFCPSPSDGSTPSANPKLLSADETSIKIWELADTGLNLLTDITTEDVMFIGGVSWDALHPNEVAIACDSSIHVWDTRSKERTKTIEHAVPAGCCVRAVSYNTNKPWHLASGGDDYKVKLWDLRRPTAPIKILDGHTHWYVQLFYCYSFSYSDSL